jgi:hypothetical protein
MIEKLLYPYHRARMSELGKELLEAAQHDEWKVSEHRWTHAESKICFWVSNNFNYFRLHEAGSFGESTLQHALNYHDRKVLWVWFRKHKANTLAQPAEQTLNLLRLKRQHPTEKET